MTALLAAEDRRTVVITADERILSVAGDLAEPLGGQGVVEEGIPQW